MSIVIFGLLALVIGYRATTAEDRTRLLQQAQAWLERAVVIAAHGRSDCRGFRETLRTRTRWVLTMPAIACIHVAVFVFMASRPGSVDTNALLEWGANFGPRTTNGEWWRLLTSTFVHAGWLPLIVSLAAVMQAGVILERWVGHITLALIYVASGALASLVSLAAHPVALMAGATGAICGVYGLLISAMLTSLINRGATRIPLVALKRLLPAAGVFVAYNLAVGGLELAPSLTGFLSGLVGGVVLTLGIGNEKPPIRRLATAVAAAFIFAVTSAVPLRGFIDVRPTIQELVAVEGRTASAYRENVERFKEGRISAEALARVIDRTIMPQFGAAGAHLKALGRMPDEHRALAADATEYLRLRDESWRLRAAGLNKADMPTLRRADVKELESLRAFQRIKPVGAAPTPPSRPASAKQARVPHAARTR